MPFSKHDTTAVRATNVEANELTTENVHIRSKSRDFGTDGIPGVGGSSSSHAHADGHGPVEILDGGERIPDASAPKKPFAYYRTKQFWLLLLLGYVEYEC